MTPPDGIGDAVIERSTGSPDMLKREGHGLLREGLGASVERHLRGYFAAHKGQLPASGLYERVLREVEKPLLELALAACNGNQIKAAALLGLNRNTLRALLKSHRIRPVRETARLKRALKIRELRGG